MRPDAVLCQRDGERTVLTCARCATPICPRCLVRTPVGMKCIDCGGPGAGSRPVRPRRWLAPVGVAAIVLAALVVPRLQSSPSSSLSDPGAPVSGTIVSEPLPVRIGQPTRDADLLLVVSAFECGGTTAAGGRLAQGRFCFLSVGMRNVGTAPAVFLASAQMLADPLARRFGPDLSATAAHPANAGRDLASLVVNPGNEVQAVLVYDVPPDVMPAAASLRAGPPGPGGAAVVNLALSR